MKSASLVFRALLMRNGDPVKEGDIIRRPKLAATLQKIAESPMDFYDPRSQLAQDIAADIQDRGQV